MKKLLFLIFLAMAMNVQSQVSINNDNSVPDNSAMLDVKSTSKGILLPRMTLVQRNAISSPATGLMIWQTDNIPGFYYNSGTGASPVWVSSTGSPWRLTGNSGTSAGTNFIGTTDNQPLRFRVNNAWAGEIHPTSGNLFFGMGAGQANTTGQANTASGEHSLFANTAGNFNSAYGNYSLSSNTTGYSNTALGSYALGSNNLGFSNTAVGRNSLFANTNGNYNTATGEGALLTNTSGGFNTANGYWALYSNTTGVYNNANGSQALFSNTTGGGNNASGANALFSNTTGDYNTALGGLALYNNTTGSNNIAIGISSGTAPGFTDLYNTIGIGNDGGYQHGASNQVVIGNASILVIAGKVGWSVLSDARIKNTITEDVKGLDFILKLRPVTYHISNAAITAVTGSIETPDFPGKYDGEKVKYSGFIAQEVEQAAKEANYEFSGYDIPKNEWGLYTIKYAEFVVPLVKAVQELSASLIAQKLINEELLKRIEKLENK